jgi:DNA-directed RNA polymerase specialized sigma24 family protein
VIEQNVGLIKKAQAGDLVAWESLLATVYPPALRQARALLRDEDLAEDAVQNALIKMHSHLHSLVEIAAFSAWWRRIVTNEVYMILRLKQRETQGWKEFYNKWAWRWMSWSCCVANWLGLSSYYP